MLRKSIGDDYVIKAVIFDLDGVLVTTDEFHFDAWKRLAEQLGISDFTKADNVRQRGVSRMASLEVLLEKSDNIYTDSQKLELADIKNNYYVKLLETLSKDDILPGVEKFLDFLKSKGIKTAVGSASKNAPFILKKTGLEECFDAICSGIDTQKSKPDPEVFLIAANKLGEAPENCLVVEDSDAGILAAKNAGMYALGVGAAFNNPIADYNALSIDNFEFEKIF